MGQAGTHSHPCSTHCLFLLRFLSSSLIEINVTFHKIHPFKVYCSVAFNIFIELYNYHLNFRTFLSPLQRNPIPISNQSPFLPQLSQQ